MHTLLSINPKEAPVTFSINDVTGHFKDLPLGRTHNVVVHEELQYAVSVGAAPRKGSCGAGLIFIDLKDPSKPTRLGCNAQDGYVHNVSRAPNPDNPLSLFETPKGQGTTPLTYFVPFQQAQCIQYRGPDKRYLGHDICYGYNEDSLTIYNVTNKANSSIISRTSNDGASHTHQGWVLDPLNQEYLLLDDEYDERDAVGPAKDRYPVTYIWDIRDLQNPKNTVFYKATNGGMNHNQYVIDGLSYQSSYGAGVRVYDVSSIPADPTGNSVWEVAYFDIHPEDDAEPGGGTVEFAGSSGSYGYFKSEFIAVNTFERGVYLVKITKRERCKRIRP